MKYADPLIFFLENGHGWIFFFSLMLLTLVGIMRSSDKDL